MASSATQKLQSEFLSCPRCSQPFKDPKALPCLHNFCKACLQLHIDEQMSGGRHTSFACPTCSKKIFVPDPSKATNLWAKQFPSNFVIKGMLDALAAGSPEIASPLESSLEASGRRRPLAQAAGPSASAANRQGTQSSSPSQRSRTGSGPNSGSFDLGSNLEMADVWGKVNELRASVQSEQTSIMSSLTTLSRQREDQERTMTEAVNKLQEILAMRRTELFEELSTCFNDEVEKLRQRVQSCKDHLQSLTSCEDVLRSIASLPPNADAASELLESVNLQLEEVQFRTRQENPRRVVLEYDASSVYKVTEALASFGSVHVEKEESEPLPSAPAHANPVSLAATQASPLRSSRDNNDSSQGLPAYSAVARVPGSSAPQLVEKISPGQLSGSAQGSQVYDIAVTASGVLVMTAYEEKIVQAFRPSRLQSGKKTRGLLGRLQLETQPGCLCTLSQNYVAVVGDMCLYLIAVLPDKLELKRTIPTGKNYTGISAYGESTLVVSCQSPASVDFVGLSGFINETIDRDRASGGMLFKRPGFLTTSNKDGLLFVADGHKLLCLNNAGKVKYEFPKADGEPLSHAEGVCCDPAGFVYLVDRGRQRVLALSARGTRIADVLGREQGVSDPCAVTLDSQGLLYVTNDFMDVLVFKMF